MGLLNTRLKNLSFGAVFIFIVGSAFLLHKINYEDWNYFFHYQRLPININEKSYKLILLWTPVQGNWKNWGGHVGHNEIIEECETIKLNAQCRVTTNKDHIKLADVVLFSLQDLKQVFQLQFLLMLPLKL